jgi:hypothetical protein
MFQTVLAKREEETIPTTLAEEPAVAPAMLQTTVTATLLLHPAFTVFVFFAAISKPASALTICSSGSSNNFHVVPLCFTSAENPHGARRTILLGVAFYNI